MTYDHRTSTIHQAELDREIDTIRNERLLATAQHRTGWTERARRATGRFLISIGTVLIGAERSQLRTHRA